MSSHGGKLLVHCRHITHPYSIEYPYADCPVLTCRLNDDCPLFVCRLLSNFILAKCRLSFGIKGSYGGELIPIYKWLWSDHLGSLCGILRGIFVILAIKRLRVCLHVAKDVVEKNNEVKQQLQVIWTEYGECYGPSAIPVLGHRSCGYLR